MKEVDNMLKPDKNKKVIHYNDRQMVYCFTDKYVSVITEKINELITLKNDDSNIRKTCVDCIDMASEMDRIHGTLTAKAPDLQVENLFHVIVVVHDEVWQKVDNDYYPDYATGDVEEIYYKGA